MNSALWQRVKQWFELHSIKQHLSFWLLLFLIPALLIITFRSYLSIQYFTNQANDQSLFKLSLAIANDISITPTHELHLEPNALSTFKKHLKGDFFSYTILNPQQTALIGKTNLPLPAELPKSGNSVFYSKSVDGKDLRLVAFNYPVSNTNVIIIVAETLKLRKEMHEDILLVFVITTLLITLLVILALNLSIKRGLSSLELFKNEILARHPTDTEPLNTQSAPKELHPLVMAMNDLFTRMKHIVDEKENFIANASHQLKTPLAGLKLQLENAQRETDLASLKEALKEVNVSTDKLTRLNNQLLNLAIVEFSGKNNPDPKAANTKFDLIALALEVTAEWVPAAISKKMDLGVSHDRDHLEINGQALLIRELLNNLLDNAITYNTAETVITVNITMRAGFAVLSVKDNGTGIKLKDHQKVFQRFYRVLGENHSNGCGLGMAIVKEVAEQHGGHVTLEFSDTKKQRGTKVNCFLPISGPSY